MIGAQSWECEIFSFQTTPMLYFPCRTSYSIMIAAQASECFIKVVFQVTCVFPVQDLLSLCKDKSSSDKGKCCIGKHFNIVCWITLYFQLFVSIFPTNDPLSSNKLCCNLRPDFLTSMAKAISPQIHGHCQRTAKDFVIQKRETAL